MLLSVRFDVSKLTSRSVPRLEDLALPEARFRPPKSLTSIIDQSDAERASHTYGKSYRDVVRGLDRDFSVAPDAVAFPKTDTEIAALMDWCGDERIALIPYGGGSSVVGGVEARLEGDYRGAMSLDAGDGVQFALVASYAPLHVGEGRWLSFGVDLELGQTLARVLALVVVFLDPYLDESIPQ